MNNKPFGWYLAGMIFEGKEGEQEAKDFENGLNKDGFKEKAIPLYTHPADLTDEEIIELARPHGDLAWQDCIFDFARAVLRKAQQ